MFKFNSTLDKTSVKNISSLTLAFIGDAVYSLFVREKLVFYKDEKGSELNRKTAEVVCASSQADYIDFLMPYLTSEEIEVYKRGRNAKKSTRAKNATVGEYNKSTGFEALVGYLYILGEIDRLNYLLNLKEEMDEPKDENV